MKKSIHLISIILFYSYLLPAQLNLTQSANEPVAGDLYHYRNIHDTAANIPRNIGTNQTWDFSAMKLSTILFVSEKYEPVGTNVSFGGIIYHGSGNPREFNIISQHYFTTVSGKPEMI